MIGWALAASTVVINERFLPRSIPGVIGALIYVAVILAGGIALGTVGGIALDHTLSPRGSQPARA